MKTIALFIALQAGCSFMTASVPDNYMPSQGEPNCNQKGAMVLDSVVAGTGALLMASDEPGLQAVGAPLLIGYGIAALWGRHKMDRCREAMTAWEESGESPTLSPVAQDDDEEPGPEVDAPSESPRVRQLHEAEALLGTISSSTSTRATIGRENELVLFSVDDSLTCAQLRWTGPVAAQTSALSALNIDTVTCKAGGFTVWSGGLLELPSIIEETECRPFLERIGSAANRHLQATHLAKTPAACRAF